MSTADCSKKNQDEVYFKKLEELQKYMPLLESIIARITKAEDKTREEHLQKLKRVHDILSRKNRQRLKLDLLNKCEKLLKLAFAKLENKRYVCTKVSYYTSEATLHNDLHLPLVTELTKSFISFYERLQHHLNRTISSVDICKKNSNLDKCNNKADNGERKPNVNALDAEAKYESYANKSVLLENYSSIESQESSKRNETQKKSDSENQNCSDGTNSLNRTKSSCSTISEGKSNELKLDQGAQISYTHENVSFGLSNDSHMKDHIACPPHHPLVTDSHSLSWQRRIFVQIPGKETTLASDSDTSRLTENNNHIGTEQNKSIKEIQNKVPESKYPNDSKLNTPCVNTLSDSVCRVLSERCSEKSDFNNKVDTKQCQMPPPKPGSSGHFKKPEVTGRSNNLNKMHCYTSRYKTGSWQLSGNNKPAVNLCRKVPHAQESLSPYKNDNSRNNTYSSYLYHRRNGTLSEFCQNTVSSHCLGNYRNPKNIPSLLDTKIEKPLMQPAHTIRNKDVCGPSYAAQLIAPVHTLLSACLAVKQSYFNHSSSLKNNNHVSHNYKPSVDCTQTRQVRSSSLSENVISNSNSTDRNPTNLLTQQNLNLSCSDESKSFQSKMSERDPRRNTFQKRLDDLNSRKLLNDSVTTKTNCEINSERLNESKEDKACTSSENANKNLIQQKPNHDLNVNSGLKNLPSNVSVELKNGSDKTVEINNKLQRDRTEVRITDILQKPEKQDFKGDTWAHKTREINSYENVNSRQQHVPMDNKTIGKVADKEPCFEQNKEDCSRFQKYSNFSSRIDRNPQPKARYSERYSGDSRSESDVRVATQKSLERNTFRDFNGDRRFNLIVKNRNNDQQTEYCSYEKGGNQSRNDAHKEYARNNFRHCNEQTFSKSARNSFNDLDSPMKTNQCNLTDREQFDTERHSFDHVNRNKFHEVNRKSCERSVSKYSNNGRNNGRHHQLPRHLERSNDEQKSRLTFGGRNLSKSRDRNTNSSEYRSTHNQSVLCNNMADPTQKSSGSAKKETVQERSSLDSKHLGSEKLNSKYDKDCKLKRTKTESKLNSETITKREENTTARKPEAGTSDLKAGCGSSVGVLKSLDKEISLKSESNPASKNFSLNETNKGNTELTKIDIGNKFSKKKSSNKLKTALANKETSAKISEFSAGCYSVSENLGVVPTKKDILQKKSVPLNSSDHISDHPAVVQSCNENTVKCHKNTVDNTATGVVKKEKSVSLRVNSSDSRTLLKLESHSTKKNHCDVTVKFNKDEPSVKDDLTIVQGKSESCENVNKDCNSISGNISTENVNGRTETVTPSDGIEKAPSEVDMNSVVGGKDIEEEQKGLENILRAIEKMLIEKKDSVFKSEGLLDSFSDISPDKTKETICQELLTAYLQKSHSFGFWQHIFDKLFGKQKETDKTKNKTFTKIKALTDSSSFDNEDDSENETDKTSSVGSLIKDRINSKSDCQIPGVKANDFSSVIELSDNGVLKNNYKNYTADPPGMKEMRKRNTIKKRQLNLVSNTQNSVIKKSSVGKRKRKPYKSELERLHDDIKGMFISRDVLNLTAIRACRLKHDDTCVGHVSVLAEPISDLESDCKSLRSKKRKIDYCSCDHINEHESTTKEDTIQSCEIINLTSQNSDDSTDQIFLDKEDKDCKIRKLSIKKSTSDTVTPRVKCQNMTKKSHLALQMESSSSLLVYDIEDKPITDYDKSSDVTKSCKDLEILEEGGKCTVQPVDSTLIEIHEDNMGVSAKTPVLSDSSVQTVNDEVQHLISESQCDKISEQAEPSLNVNETKFTELNAKENLSESQKKPHTVDNKMMNCKIIINKLTNIGESMKRTGTNDYTLCAVGTNHNSVLFKNEIRYDPVSNCEQSQGIMKTPYTDGGEKETQNEEGSIVENTLLNEVPFIDNEISNRLMSNNNLLESNLNKEVKPEITEARVSKTENEDEKNDVNSSYNSSKVSNEISLQPTQQTDYPNQAENEYYQDKNCRKIMKCKLCTYSSRSILLVKHYKTAHPDHEVMVSRLSQNVVNEALRQTFMIYSDNKAVRKTNKSRYLCRLCPRVCSHAISFYDHISSHTGEYRFSCLNCSYEASNKDAIKSHFYKDHFDSALSKTVEYKKVFFVKPLVGLKNTVYTYVCLECNYFQLSVSNVRRHIKQCHGILEDDVKTIARINFSLDNGLSFSNYRVKNSSNVVTSNEWNDAISTLITADGSRELSCRISSEASAVQEVPQNEASHTSDKKFNINAFILSEPIEYEDNRRLKDVDEDLTDTLVENFKTAGRNDDNVYKISTKLSINRNLTSNKCSNLRKRKRPINKSYKNHATANSKRIAKTCTEEISSNNSLDNIVDVSEIPSEKTTSLKCLKITAPKHNTLGDAPIFDGNNNNNEACQYSQVVKMKRQEKTENPGLNYSNGSDNKALPLNDSESLLNDSSSIESKAKMSCLMSVVDKLSDALLNLPEKQTVAKDCNLESSLCLEPSKPVKTVDVDDVLFFNVSFEQVKETIQSIKVGYVAVYKRECGVVFSCEVEGCSVKPTADCRLFLKHIYKCHVGLRFSTTCSACSVSGSQESTHTAAVNHNMFTAFSHLIETHLNVWCYEKEEAMEIDLEPEKLQVNDTRSTTSTSVSLSNADVYCNDQATDPVHNLRIENVISLDASACATLHNVDRSSTPSHTVAGQERFEDCEGTTAQANRQSSEPLASNRNPEQSPCNYRANVVPSTAAEPERRLIANTSYVSSPEFCSLSAFPDLQSDVKRIVTEAASREAYSGVHEYFNWRSQLARAVKHSEIFTRMQAPKKLRHLFKCMDRMCSFTCDSPKKFEAHCQNHIDESLKKPATTFTIEALGDWRMCVYCGDSFNNPSDLRQHIEQEHSQSAYQCAFCFYRAICPSNVTVHQRISHPGEFHSNPILHCPVKEPLQSPEKPMSNYNDIIRPYTCSIEFCNMKTYIAKVFEEHLSEHSNLRQNQSCLYCGDKNLKAEFMIEHYKVHSMNLYQCTYCVHGTDTEHIMQLHLCTRHPDYRPIAIMRVSRSLHEQDKFDASTEIDNLKKCDFSDSVYSSIDIFKREIHRNNNTNDRPVTKSCDIINISDD